MIIFKSQILQGDQLQLPSHKRPDLPAFTLAALQLRLGRQRLNPQRGGAVVGIQQVHLLHRPAERLFLLLVSLVLTWNRQHVSRLNQHI